MEINNENITINALRRDTLERISVLLNPVKHFQSDEGYSRDWRGLAACCNLDSTEFQNIRCSNNQTQLVLEKWHKKDKENSTVQNLMKFLEQIDRHDIIEDITELVEADLALYKENPSGSVEPPEKFRFEIITKDDEVLHKTGKSEPQRYDAFVLFADADINFASKLMDNMENDYKLRLCSKWRDLLAGALELVAIQKLITDRCNKLVVILSDKFLESEEYTFYYNYARTLDISMQQRKIIPCTYNSPKLPPQFNMYFCLDYERTLQLPLSLYDFWQKLAESIRPSSAKTTPSVPTIQVTPPEPQVNLQSKMSVSNSSKTLHTVTFQSCSMGDLSAIEEQDYQEPRISSSVSDNSLGSSSPVTSPKPPKQKNIFKKIISRINHNKTNKRTPVAQQL